MRRAIRHRTLSSTTQTTVTVLVKTVQSLWATKDLLIHARSWRKLAWLLLVPIANGCVMVPTAVPGQDRLQQQARTKFVIGETRQEQVQQILGQPTMRGEDWWFYRAERNGWQWGGCEISSSGTCGKSPRSRITSYLVVQFDPAGTVLSYRFPDAAELCSKDHICYQHGRSNSYIREASEPTDGIGDDLLPLPGHCAIYIYSGDRELFHISHNGQYLGKLFNSDAYVRSVQLASMPTSTIRVSDGQNRPYYRPVPKQQLELPCEAQQIKFLRISKKLLGGLNFAEVDQETGRGEIGRRWHALSELE